MDEIEFDKLSEADWVRILKKCPDNAFMTFFEDNPEMGYVTVTAGIHHPNGLPTEKPR